MKRLGNFIKKQIRKKKRQGKMTDQEIAKLFAVDIETIKEIKTSRFENDQTKQSYG